MTPQILKNAASGAGAHVAAQVSTQNWRSRLVLAIMAVSFAVAGFATFPGWVPEVRILIEGAEQITPGFWRFGGDTAQQIAGLVGIGLAAGWNTKPSA